MKISVIIPMYNAENTIVSALDSIKNQTYQCEYEIIIVNDGS
ncbi:MAG: glycosyltransferase, partial [Capnocytophaga sp.]|nr:glycosyltransferase [Capnocytophaga sp.]